MKKSKENMKQSIRDVRQKEFADVWLKHGKYGILNLCPR
jgi:hypothetical protein